MNNKLNHKSSAYLSKLCIYIFAFILTSCCFAWLLYEVTFGFPMAGSQGQILTGLTSIIEKIKFIIERGPILNVLWLMFFWYGIMLLPDFLLNQVMYDNKYVKLNLRHSHGYMYADVSIPWNQINCIDFDKSFLIIKCKDNITYTFKEFKYDEEKAKQLILIKSSAG
jgi:hypothetical protein